MPKIKVCYFSPTGGTLTSNDNVYHLKIQDEEIDPRMIVFEDANMKSTN